MNYKFRYSMAFQKLDKRAIDKEDTLFPEMAMEWIEDAYGKRAERISPKTLADMVYDLCLRNGYEPDCNEIISAVNAYIHA